MISIQVKGHVGEDGLLTLKIPTSYRDTELEAILIINPVGNAGKTSRSNPNGWPVGFLEATAGSITDETFRRLPQGEYEERESSVKYLPDTNVCVAYLRAQSPKIIARFAACPFEDIVLCDIVKTELYYGAYKSARPEVNIIKIEAFFAPFISIPFDTNSAAIFGRIRRELEEVGTPIGPYDLLIAAIALADNLTLITHNTREFGRITGLKFEDWEE